MDCAVNVAEGPYFDQENQAGEAGSQEESICREEPGLRQTVGIRCHLTD